MSNCITGASFAVPRLAARTRALAPAPAARSAIVKGFGGCQKHSRQSTAGSLCKSDGTAIAGGYILGKVHLSVSRQARRRFRSGVGRVGQAGTPGPVSSRLTPRGARRGGRFVSSFGDMFQLIGERLSQAPAPRGFPTRGINDAERRSAVARWPTSGSDLAPPDYGFVGKSRHRVALKTLAGIGAARPPRSAGDRAQRRTDPSGRERVSG
jgi:hypothetical protein